MSRDFRDELRQEIARCLDLRFELEKQAPAAAFDVAILTAGIEAGLAALSGQDPIATVAAWRGLRRLV